MSSQKTHAKLVVEGGIKILYKGVWVTEIPLDVDEIEVGVMDPENEIYPDVNLRQYRLDGGDPYISREHARFIRAGDRYYVEDRCGNNSTSIGTKTNVLNEEKRELEHGDRIFISESIGLLFQIVAEEKGEGSSTSGVEAQDGQEAAETTGESQETAETTGESQEAAEATGESQETAETTGESQETAEATGESQETAETTGESQETAETTGESQGAAGEENVDAPVVDDPEGQSEPKREGYYLEVEGEEPLFFKPRNTFTYVIDLVPEEWENVEGVPAIQIGRRSTEDGIYPDIDLWKFYFNDGDEYIGRKHAQIFAQDDDLYFQDISGKGSTWINERDDEHRLLRTATDEASKKIEVGDKIMISDSVVFTVRKH